MLQTLTSQTAALLLLTAKRNVMARRALGVCTADQIDPACRHSTCEDCGGPEHRGVVCPAVRRALARHPESAIHAAADKHLRPLFLAVRAAFNLGRKALGNPPKPEVAKTAVHNALLKVLPTVILATMKSGGEAAVKTLRTAGDFEGHEFHGNQWTSREGGVVYHGTHSGALDSILSEGLKPSGSKGASVGDGHAKVNLARDIGDAHQFAVYASQANPGTVPVVLRIQLPKTSKASLARNNRRTVVHAGVVAKEHIVLYEKLDASLNKWRGAKKPSTPLHMRFDVSNPKAVKWAKKHAAELAVELSDTTEKDVRKAITKAVAGGGIRDAYDEIADAVGDAARAELIARTEIMTAANQGQRTAWSDAVDEGLLSSNSRVAWIATDGACAEICEPMDGQTRDLDGGYDGQEPPPAHPNCRCTEGIVG